MELVKQEITKVANELFSDSKESVEVSRPDAQFGDYSTNVAMKLSAKMGKNPREIADQIASRLKSVADFSDVTVAGPGFINVKVRDGLLLDMAKRAPERMYAGISYVVEYSCPNAFKELHTGHLYQTIAGDVIARIIDRGGANTHRTSFGGDVGLHVAKCLYGIIEEIGGELPEKLADVSSDAMSRASWISKCYVYGSGAYEDSTSAKEKINLYNQAVYKIHEADDHDSPLAKIYWTTRQWSFDYFDAFYNLIQVEQMHYYPESSTSERGLEMVRAGLEKGIFKNSEGAVVFEGDPDKHLHTRVFITGKGLPTYETKDIGVIFKEKDDFNFDRRLLITGNEQTEYMKVVFAASDMLLPGLAGTMLHLTNGTVRFGDGKKMSSRLGNVSRAIDVVEIVREKVREMGTDESRIDDVALGAIKYEFLRYRLGGDIAFDVEGSVNLQGNSGPYLQYAHARACSILSKSGEEPVSTEVFAQDIALEDGERLLARKLSEYAEVMELSCSELLPHHICNYLYELSQEFNRFYEKNRIIGDTRQATRLELVKIYKATLADGLGLLGIKALETM